MHRGPGVYRPVECIKQIFQEKELPQKGLALASEEPVVALAVAVYQPAHFLTPNREPITSFLLFIYVLIRTFNFVI